MHAPTWYTTLGNACMIAMGPIAHCTDSANSYLCTSHTMWAREADIQPSSHVRRQNNHTTEATWSQLDHITSFI